MLRIGGSFQSSWKTRSTLYKFIWFLHLLTKPARRCTFKFMVKKFTDAEKFVGSRRQCSTYFKWVSSRLATSSRGLPEIVLGTQSRKAFGDFGERSKPRRTEKGEKKIRTETWVKLSIKPEEINFNQSIIFLRPLFSGSELKCSYFFYCKNWTYLPAILVKLLLGVNIRANIFRMEKQNITISDECSGFRAQYYTPRSEFIYNIIEI